MYIAYISSVSMVKQSIKSTERQSLRFIPFFSIIVLESYDKFIRVNTMNYPLLLPPFFFFPPILRLRANLLLRLLALLIEEKEFTMGSSLDRR